MNVLLKSLGIFIGLLGCVGIVLAEEMLDEPMLYETRLQHSAKRNRRTNFLDRFKLDALGQPDDQHVDDSKRVNTIEFLLKQQQSLTSSPSLSPISPALQTPYSTFLTRLQNSWRQPNFSIKAFENRHWDHGSSKSQAIRKASMGEGHRSEKRESGRMNKSSKKMKTSKKKSSEKHSSSTGDKKKKRKKRDSSAPSYAPTTLAPTAMLVGRPSPGGTLRPSLLVPDMTSSPTSTARTTDAPTPRPTVASTFSPTALVSSQSTTPRPTNSVSTLAPVTSTAAPTIMPTTLAPTTMSPTLTRNATSAPTSASSTGSTTSSPTAVSTTAAPTQASTTASPTARPTTLAPTPQGTTATPTAPQPLPVTVPRFYIGLVAPGATRSPTDDEYSALTNRTSAYFSSFLNNTYADNDNIEFTSLDLALNNTRFELGVPEPRYNIYMDFSMEARFSPDSTADSPAQIFSLLVPAINSNFILNEVRMIPDSPFVTVNEAVFASAVALD